MKNTRTGQRTIRKLLKGAGSAILLATLFVLVFAGTLSGAFGVEENLQQNGIIESNVADAYNSNASTDQTFISYDDVKDGNEVTLTGATLAKYWTSVSLQSNTKGKFVYNGDDSNAGWTASYFWNRGSDSNVARTTLVLDGFRATGYTLTWTIQGYFKSGNSGSDDQFMYLGVKDNTNGGSYSWAGLSASDLTTSSGSAGKWDGYDTTYGYYYYRTGNNQDTQIYCTRSATRTVALSNMNTIGVEFDAHWHNGRYDWDNRRMQNLNASITSLKIKFTGVVEQKFSGGSGTSDDPFILANRRDFEEFTTRVSANGETFLNQYLKVQPDTSNSQNGYINMLSTAYTPGGVYDSGSHGSFRGHFDGNNVEIRNLVISVGSGTARAGLIGTAGSGAVISNVHIASGSSITSQRSDAAGVVGYVAGSVTVSGCVNDASIYSPLQNGGIVANVAKGATLKISNCKNNGTVGGMNIVGGIVGYVQGTATISNCTNETSATIDCGSEAGGIVGYAIGKTSISSSQNKAAVGNNKGNKISATGYTNGYEVVHRDGYPNGDENWDNLKDGKTSTKFFTDGKNTMSFIIEIKDTSNFVTGFAIANGNDTESQNNRKPTRVQIWGSNTDNTGSDTTTSSNAGNTPAGSGLSGWTSIYDSGEGDNLGMPTTNYYRKDFTFGLNKFSQFKYLWIHVTGNGKLQLSEFEILRSENVGGIVGNATSEVTVESVTNSGTVTGGNYVGGVVGQGANTKIVTKAENSGAVNGINYVGGISGSINGTISNNSTLTNKAVITGSGNYVGGIFGSWTNQDVITGATFEAYGTFSGASYVGGVAGYVNTNGKNISATFKTGVGSAGVEGEVVAMTGLYGGGFFGFAEGGSTITFGNGSVTTDQIDAYESNKAPSRLTGAVVGGAVGANINLTLDFSNCTSVPIQNTFILRSAKTVTIGSNTYEKATMSGGIVGYNGGTVKGSASIYMVESQYIFCTVAANYLGGAVGYNAGTIENCRVSYTNSVGGLSSGGITFVNVTYVGGLVGYNAGSMSGTFTSSIARVDGKDYVGGLIGYNNYVDKNNNGITINGYTNNVSIYGDNYVGGLIGMSGSAITLTNCVNKGNVSGNKAYVGGIIGVSSSNGNFENCSNSGAISGKGDDVGGIAGRVENGSISGTTTNSNTVTSTAGEHIGGIVGYALNVKFTGTITNNGDVSAESSKRVGGVVGYFKTDNSNFTDTDKTLSGASNTGDVTGAENVGGIVGVLEGSIIDGATNTGTITANGNDVGGIVGWNVKGSTVKGTLTNSGSINGKNNDNVGGIVGYNTGVISGAFTIDGITVKGRSSVGGIVGFNDTDGSVTISGVSNVGAALSGASYVGGVIGYSIGALSLTSSATNNATVTATGDYAGGFFAYVKKSGLTFSNLTNNADIKGVNYIGGIFGGIASSMTITNCTNNATVAFNSNVTTTSSNEYAGGIIGGIFADDSVSVTIEGCANTKDITATSNVGGILGGVVKDTDNITALNIYKCANSGKITSKADNTGGIVGRAYTKLTKTGTDKLIIHIFNCYNVGEIARADDADTSTGDSTGGIVGYLYAAGTNASAALVEYCYNYSNVTGRKCVAGIVGGGTSSGYFTIDHCYVVVDNDHKLTAKANTIGAIVGGAYNGEVLSNYKVTNSWGFFPLNANNTGFNDLGEVVFSDFTLTPQVLDGNTWTDVVWTDILSKNINGFKLNGTTSEGKYAASVWGISSVSGADYDYKNVAKPSKIATSATANNGSTDAQKNSEINVTFYYDASFINDYATAKGLKVYVEDIDSTAKQSKEYNAQNQFITYPTTPQIIDGGYGCFVVYFDDADRTLNRTDSGKIQAGTYYYIADITLDGVVVGRYKAEFEITEYTFDGKKFGEDFWFGANDSVIVTNQGKYELAYNEGTVFLFLLNGSSTQRPQVLIYQDTKNGSYNVNNFVLYIKYKIIDANGEEDTVIKQCTEFEITQFVEALADGEHVREGTQITAEGKGGNVVGEISRYYTLLDSDFGWIKNTTNDKSWGTIDNPYVISSQAQLMRLSQILNGDKAWNSINDGLPIGESGIVLAADPRAIATDKTYSGAYFVVTADIHLDDTFKPIGNNGVIFKAASFASNTPGSRVEISYFYNNSETDYVGLFGNVEGTHFKDLLVRGASYDGTSYTGKQIVGKDYVGGLVGHIKGGIIENCTFTSNYATTNPNYYGYNVCIVGQNYVGGLVGYAEGTQILYDTSNSNMDSSDNLVNARIAGVNYVGGILGKWNITNAAQFNNGNDLYFSASGANIIVVSTGSYAGAIAGELDASNCADKFDLNARLYYKSGTTNPHLKAQVVGTNYVGALYGSFIGGGTDKTTLTYGEHYLYATVRFAAADCNVVGGFIGYLQDATLAFAYNYTVDGKTIVFENAPEVTSKPSFFGGIVGVLGKGANISNGTAVNDGNKSSVTLKNSLAFGTSTNPYGDFVGGIIGYVSSGAGRSNLGSTIFGDDLIFVNNGSIRAHSYVGGIIGAIGIVDEDKYTVSGEFEGKNIIVNTLKNGSPSGSANNNIVTFKPSSAQNVAAVYGVKYDSKNAEYVGGLVGGVFKKALIYLENEQVQTLGDIDNPQFAIFNKAIVSGDIYIGGIVGYLDQESHVLNRIVNIGNSSSAYIGKTDASYVGGLVGYMVGGKISNSAAASQATPSATSNVYLGSNYVGGLVGYMSGGTLENSISTGFKFDGNNTSITKGGVVGNVLSANIEGSWTIYIATNPTYSTVSPNKNGKYVLVDSTVLSEVGAYNHVLAMAGVCEATEYNNYNFKQGELLIGVGYPTKTNFGGDIKDENPQSQLMQLAFYDVSGTDTVMKNGTSVFSSDSVIGTIDGQQTTLASSNGIVRIGVSMADGESYSVCKVEVKFSNISKYKGSDDGEGNLNAQEGYRAPSGADTRYRAEVTTALYDSDGNITRIVANIYFKDILVGSVEGIVGGYDSGTLTPGGSEATPLTISTQEEWNDFAWQIYTGQNDYKNQYVKLLTDITIEKKAKHVGTNNAEYDFTSVTTPNSNASDSKNATSNLGYNITGNLAQGADNTLSYVTVDGTRGGVTPSFKGTFDGDGHTITINFTEQAHRASVFPNAEGATFRNLTVAGKIQAASKMDGYGNQDSSNKDIVSKTAGYDVAGFVGKPFGRLDFYNCINQSNIIGLRNVAGIVGYNIEKEIVLDACVNEGNITGLEGSYTIAGRSTDCSYDDFKNIDWLTSNEAYPYGTGGIIGGTKGSLTIDSCRNTGTVIGGYNAGGIIGYSDGTSASTIATLTIDSCANSGKVVSNSGYWGASASSEDEGQKDGYIYNNAYGIRMNIFGYAGGLVGRTGKYSLLRMYASYNSGEVITYSNISGGLIGSVGYMGQSSGDKNSVVTPGKSYIAYCYNTGTIRAGGTFPKHTKNWGWNDNEGVSFGRENHGGDIVGGIAGLVGNVLISDCYNVGDVYAYGITCYSGSWQLRAGGIVGQADPVGSDQSVTYTRCYNLGTVYSRQIKNTMMKYNNYDALRYGGGISGYCDGENNSADRIYATNCYSIKYAVNVQTAEQGYSWSEYKYQNGSFTWYNGPKTANWLYAEVSILGITVQEADVKYVKTGDIINDVSDFTAVLNSNSTIGLPGKAIRLDTSNKGVNSYNNTNGSQVNFNLGTASATAITSSLRNNTSFSSSWMYVYGCLPQLAVFAVDTYNGLSMRSVNYGRDVYGEYQRGIAGTEFSPYVIKDGIDLLGLQALVDAGYSFDDKYIEFADGTNNLEESVSKTINMPSDSGSVSSNAYKYSEDGKNYVGGKSYHLFERGAASDYTNWKAVNYAYKSGNSTSAGATFADQNFIPIGRKGGNNIFKGNISGAQADGNTEIANLRITYRGNAGLFGYVQDAEVHGITVSGNVYSYSSGSLQGNRSVAGGIVAYAYGSSVIDGCQAGSTLLLDVRAYGATSTYSNSDAETINASAGGIVGEVNTATINGSTYHYSEGTTSTIKGNTTVNANVASVKNNIGGTVGFATGRASLTVNAKDMNNRVDIESNVVMKANIGALSASGCTVSDVGTKTGGILGYADENLSVIVRECEVGENNASDNVVIIGENRIGGIVGEMPDAAGEIIGCKVYKSATIKRASNWGVVSNAGESGTAIGGIVGLTYNAQGTDPITTTFSGNIVFQGKIVVGIATNYASASDRSNDGVVRNVGGIVGDMGAGARIATGSEITVRGTIEISAATDTNHANRNIGGVAGRTDDVAFSGKFDVAPTITATSAYQIGGFIGKNIGIVNILADDTDIRIGGKISASNDVGGFIGYNSESSTLLIGADQYRAVNYNGALSITIVQSVNDAEKKATIDTLISASGDNVGGIVGNSAESGYVQIVKGTIVNKGQVSGNDNVGGIIGINDGNFSTGGSVYDTTLEIVNEGKVGGNDYVGGVIGKLNIGEIAGKFVNRGNVSGIDYVGGSIGFVSDAASIKSTSSGKTEFVNEAVAIAKSSDALVSSDATVADDSLFNVSGRNYVGGSIGLLLGQSLGNEEFKVEFRSKGTVNGEKYVGGSIGVLAGRTEYTDFISEGEMSGIDATTAVGGSVGFIGVPNPLINDMADADIVVKNTHFEANGTLTLNATSEKPTSENEYVWGGIGGAIGAIGNATDNLFDNTDGTRWVDNTYYASGNVTAEGFYHVGGIVGLIKADNITIENMLAYDTKVTGGKNVGGIVGATIGKKTVINSAFSISTNENGGIFTATLGNAGGIIGLAQDDTDAGTSYWVKGYTNAELAGSSVTNLKTTLGRYTLAFESFTVTENGETRTVTVVFTKALIGTGATSTSDDASTSDDTTTGGDDTTGDEEVAIYPTPYDYYDSVGTHTVGSTTYTIIKEEADELGYTLIEETLTWQAYFDMTFGKDKDGNSRIKYQKDVGAWVEETSDWKEYSTGTQQTGWYFVYANDQSGEGSSIGTISAVHTTSTADGYSDLWYWKRIANAYTMSERNAGYDDDTKANSPYKTGNPLSSAIVRETVDGAISTVPHNGTLYATATAADFMTNANASGYYMYIASSGSTKPTSVYYKTEGDANGKFFIQAEGGVSQNVAVYYRSIAMGSALTYNGYERYAPISLPKSDVTYSNSIKNGQTTDVESEKNKYYYNTQNVETETKEYGTYHSTVNVFYFDNSGTAYVVGGIDNGVWRITKRKLKLTQTGMKDTSYTYGEKYDGENGGILTTLTLENIVDPDRATFYFEIPITDAKGTVLATIKWSTVNGIQTVTITENSAEITVSAPYWKEVKNTKSESDKKYTVGDKSNGKAYGATFAVTYKMAKTYNVETSKSKISDTKNYQLENATHTLNVERRSLSLTLNPTNAQFNNSIHTATWTIGGKGILSTDDVATVLSQFSPKVYAKLGDNTSGYQTYSEDWTNPANSIQIKNGSTVVAEFMIEGNTIKVTNASNVGSYYIVFSAPSDNCNYKFESHDTTAYTSPEFTISINTLTVTWKTNKAVGYHTYDAKTYGEMIATIEAQYAITNYADFILAYFNQYLDGTALADNAKIAATVNGQIATIVFKTTSFNAGKYSAGLEYSGKVQEVNCRVVDGNGTALKDGKSTQAYEIKQATLTLKFVGMTGTNVIGTYPNYTYNTRAQGLSSIEVTDICGSDDIYLTVSSTKSGNTISVASSGKVSNGKLNVTLTAGFINADTYGANVRLNNNQGETKNYVLSGATNSTVSASWTISPKELSISGLVGGNVDYDATAHYPTINMTDPDNTISGGGQTGVFKYVNDTITVNYSITGSDAGVFVNKGEYKIKVADTNTITATRNGVSVPSTNYKVINKPDNEVTFTINAAKVEIVWTEFTEGMFVYNKSQQGLSIASLRFTSNNSTVTKTISGGKFAGYGTDKLTVTVSGKQTNAGNGYTMEYSSYSLDANTANSGIAPIKDNYEFTSGLESGKFNINKSALNITRTGGSITKEYDATTSVPQDQLDGLSFGITSTNKGDASLTKAAFNITAIYLDANVGTGIGIRLTYSLNSAYTTNYSYGGGSEDVTIGTITPATVIVTLDRLRNGRATRTFAEGSTGINVYYGGARGAQNIKGASSRSATYRLGEGFTISGFPSAEESGVVRIFAQYVEVGNERSAFNGYVNYIYDGGNGYVRGAANDQYVIDNNLYKSLVFSMADVAEGSGKAKNYNFKVVDTDGATMSSTVGTSEMPVTVYDSQDSKNKDRGDSKQSITIEITVKTYRIQYENTPQSYANSDGSYNTNWTPVTGKAPSGGITIEVQNGWMYDGNGNPKVYKQYTVIRGRANSTELSASVSGTNGKHLNYNMTNQPVLTIGYFVEENNDVFEIGSLSSLLIASYYWWVSANSGNPEFNQVINTTVTWNALISDEDYGNNAEFKRPAGVPDTVTTWDEYFLWLETDDGGNHIVFLNENESNTWGYYTTTTGAGEVKKYSSFKQIRDINGTFTQSDIEMLDGFFQVYDVENDKYIAKEWGYGGEFITNFLKVGVGNVAVAIGSIFKSLENGFTGAYDGGGYVIEYFNIMSFDGAENVGMFDVLGITANVKNLHLRNFTINANAGNVGGIAGKALAGENVIENVSWHGTISMSGNGNVGGLIGLSARSINKAIALGTINVKGGNIGGLIGSIEQNAGITISNAVSFVYIDATGNVGAVSASSSGATATNVFYLANSAWTRSSGTLAVSNGTYGEAETYTELMQGSISGYSAVDGKKYYQGSTKGVYDMLDDFNLSDNANRTSMNARQSMRLKDIIDVYILMYSIAEVDVKVNADDESTSKVYTISSTSWLVGDKHGTDGDEIVISNRQQVALLRELRFASFVLTADVVATVTSSSGYAYGGAFFGNVILAEGTSYTIDFGSGKSAFEALASGSSVPNKQNA